MVATQAEFYDDIKGQIFNEIINNSNQTAAEATAGLMMNNQGDSAVFMMETMMDTNPEIIGDVMQGFVQDEFDIFDHFENKGTENLNTNTTSEFTQPDTNLDMQDFKAEVFKDMITYSDENTMGTMAQLVATADTETASLIFETVVTEQQNMYVDDTTPKTNFALDLMDNLSSVNSTIVNTMYETQGELINNMMSTAMSDISAKDSGAIANIISSSGNDQLNEIVFNNIASSNDQSLSSNVFTDLADTEGGANAIMTMASTNQSLYENIAQDVDPTYMTAASLYTNTAAQYGTATTATATSTDTTTAYATGGISWTTLPKTSGTYSTSSYISINGTATSINGVDYSASDLPDGLNIDNTSGLISGTPTMPGSWNSTITATDMMDFNSFATASLQFQIIEDTSGGYNDGSGGSLSFMSTPYPPATLMVNSPISPIYLYTTGGTGNVNYTSTGLPMGLYVSSTGSIIGTPSTQTFTSSSVTIIATDSNGNTATTNLAFPKVDSSGGGDGTVTWTTTPAMFSSLTLTQGTPMSSIYLSATGSGSITYTDDAMLPAGIFLSAGGMVSGTPTSSTSTETTVTFVATDGNGDSETLIVSFPIINASGGGGGVTWTTTAGMFPSTLTENDPISSVSLSATGTGSINYYLSSGTLPPGISLAADIVSGAPTTPSATETTVTFRAEDDDTNTADLEITFPQVDASGGGSNVTWNATITGFPSTLTQSTPISSFDLSNSVTDEPTPVTYSISSGTLPSGLDLTGSTVSGTPSISGAATTVAFRVAETGSATNFSIKTVTFPAVSGGGGVTISFNTPISNTLSDKDVNESIYQDFIANASDSSVLSWTLENDLPPGVTGSAAGGQYSISGTAPSLQVATTYTFDIKAYLASQVSIFNKRTFTILINNDVNCVTPTNNVCY